MSAAGAKVRLTGCIRFSAVRTVSNRSLYIGSHRLLRHRLERLLIIRRSILVDRISLIMTQRGLALWAINKAVWIPRSEIKAEIRIPDHWTAGAALLLIVQSAVPQCSLKSHTHNPPILFSVWQSYHSRNRIARHRRRMFLSPNGFSCFFVKEIV